MAQPDIVVYSLKRGNKDLNQIIDALEEQLAKANERVRELEQAIDNELIIHCSSTEGSPKEKVKRLLDVACSWALDPKVSEQANKFAIEKKCEGINDFMQHFRYEYEGARDTDSIESFADEFTGQLRKEKE